VLDPVFIFALDMGVEGAALATVISQGVSAVWVLLFLRGRRVILRLTLRDMRPEGRIVGRIFGLGLTGFIMAGTNAVVSAVGNNQLRRFGGDLYVGVMTALTTIHEVAVMVVQGVTHGAQPVMGYNYGAGRGDRVKQGVRFIALVSVGYALLVWALLMLLPGAAMRMMGSDASLIEAGRRAMRIYFCAFPFMSLQFSGQSVFVGLGRAKQAMFFSLLRKVVLVTTLMYLLPPLWGLGANGVYLAEPISNVVGGSACFLTMYFTVYRKLKAGRDIAKA
jgi:Na+-driven multidrug efflux pump